MAEAERFEVKLDSNGVLPNGLEKRVVFHGINKSGSLAAARVIRDAYYADGRAHQFFSQYIGLPREDKSAIRIINGARQGHAFFIGHGLFDAFRRNEGQLMLTQVRHPLPRAVSVYQWQKNKHDRGVAPTSPYASGRKFPSLEDFVGRTRGVGHSQIAQLGIGFGRGAPELRRTLPPSAIYERAKEAVVERIDWFGVAELFEESIFTYAAICGLPSIQRWVKDERNEGRPMAWDLPEGTAALIEEVYEYEFRFYRWARDLFRERLQSIRFGGDFEAYKSACLGEYKDRLLQT